jgi:hypothetical protein
VLIQQPPLLEYVFFHGFDHIKHLGSVSAVLDDIVALRFHIQRHPVEWAYIQSKLACFKHHPFLSLLGPKHDFIVYFLIASLPAPVLLEFLLHAPFKAFEGTSPLIYATYLGKFEHAETLLSQGINVGSVGLDVKSLRQVFPLEAAVHYHRRSLFDLFLMQWMASVPLRLISAIFDLKSPGYWDTYMTVKLVRCNEFPEWVLEFEGKHQQLLPHLFYQNCNQWTEQELLAVLRRFLQVGCNLSAPESLKPVLKVTSLAVSH